MKKILLLLVILNISCICNAVTPVIFYSDLTSGPKTGGKDNKGAFVTIYGKNFGISQEDSTVTVGGGEVDNYPIWSDTKVCFQLGANAATGNIVITVSGQASNNLSFTVRAGNIYFVDDSAAGAGTGSYADPWQSPSSYCAAIISGDLDGAILYFREGIYDGQYASSGSAANFYFDSTNYSGESGAENAFIGYPGETVIIDGTSEVGLSNNFKFNSSGPSYAAQYILIANLNLKAYTASITAYTGWRVVSCDIQGLHNAESSGIGMITTGMYQDDTATNITILGNTMHGATSANKLDHVFYPGSGTKNVNFGCNYIYDNNISDGPIVSVNSNNAWNNQLVSSDILIHDNIIDVTTHPSRIFGVYETYTGSSFYYYNNIIIGPATADTASFYAMSGNIYYYNNSTYNVGGTGNGDVFMFYSGTGASSPTHTYAPESITLYNNIIYANSSVDDYVLIAGSSPTPTQDYNLYYGIGSYSAHNTGGGSEAHIVDNQNPLFTNVAEGDFTLQAGSPAIEAGADTTATVVYDLFGNIRTLPLDIGAHEYSSISVAVTGTALASISEADVVTGGKTLIYTLSGTTWAETIGENNPITTDFLATITGNLDWADVPITYANVVRTSDTVLTITLPAAPDYDIASTETVSFGAIPASATALNETITPSPSSFTVSNTANTVTPLTISNNANGPAIVPTAGGVAIVHQ